MGATSLVQTILSLMPSKILSVWTVLKSAIRMTGALSVLYIAILFLIRFIDWDLDWEVRPR